MKTALPERPHAPNRDYSHLIPRLVGFLKMLLLKTLAEVFKTNEGKQGCSGVRLGKSIYSFCICKNQLTCWFFTLPIPQALNLSKRGWGIGVTEGVSQPLCLPSTFSLMCHYSTGVSPHSLPSLGQSALTHYSSVRLVRGVGSGSGRGFCSVPTPPSVWQPSFSLDLCLVPDLLAIRTGSHLCCEACGKVLPFSLEVQAIAMWHPRPH